MGLWSGTKTFLTKGLSFRVNEWMCLDYVQETFDRTRMILTGMMTPKKADRDETFEDALERLGLTEEDLEERKREFIRLTYSFCIIGILILGYGAYMLFDGHPWITLITVFLSLYAFSQAFHFHFWLFQLKNRKLGCTVLEWFNSRVTTKDYKPKGPGES